jgi:hypothetical protein
MKNANARKRIYYGILFVVIGLLLFKITEKDREYNTGEIKIDPNASVFDIVNQIEAAKSTGPGEEEEPEEEFEEYDDSENEMSDSEE